jgi:hypothetical protein
MRCVLVALGFTILAGCTTASTGDTDIYVDALGVDGSWQTTTPDSGVGSDSAPPPFDVGNPDPGDTGAPCESNEDCDSGYCIEGPDGYICTELCDEQCPPGFTCKGINSGSGDVVFICVPPPPVKASLCETCEVHSTCLGEGSACISVDGGLFCGKACEGADDCPEGYECQPQEGIQSAQCVPSSGSCQCKDLNIGLARSCTVEAIGGAPNQPGALCTGLQVCESEGWGSCDLPTESCDGIDNDCDGTVDEDFKDNDGKYGTVDHCGACNLSCLALQAPNATPACDTSGASSTCTTECIGDWKDVDGIANNGCECLPTSEIDMPDVNGMDANCDGIDGEVLNGIFVSKAGDDGNMGSLDAPLRTMQAGILAATNQGKRDVYVATGVYQESVSLSDGVAVYGGYNADFNIRDLDAYQTAVIGNPPTPTNPGAVNGLSVGNAITVFDGFSVFGTKDSKAGGTSYAIYLKDAKPQLAVRNNVIVADNGTAGSSGSFGSTGTNGPSGSTGAPASNVGSQTCTAGNNAAGGSGGSKACSGTSTSGGNGGTRVCPSAPADVQNGGQTPEAQEAGKNGANNTQGAGSGGESGWDLLVGFSSCGVCSSSKTHASDGADGEQGSEGSTGGAGNACSNGEGLVNADGLWSGQSGGWGTDGLHGGGGGGGGAGGGVDVKAACSWVGKTVGGSGGGGGSGGCGGTGGGPGTSGGASFGIFAYWSTAPAAFPTVQANVIYRGYGGAGGDGGPGGLGGSGGLGGTGGTSGQGQGSFPINFCGQGGGYGGAGGHGGAGGGGAGGCGGASYGFYAWTANSNASTASMASNDYPASGGPGAAGKGGFSAGANGPAGTQGAHGTSTF